MEPNNLPSNPPFFVGQKVVAIRNSKYNYFKKDTIYSILEIRQCKCAIWIVRVGFSIIGDTQRCSICNSFMGYKGSPAYHNAENFSPYNPPRHQNVEIEKDILHMEVVEERADVLPEKILNN